jgi:hypothetical protein
LASQTSATATAADIIASKTAWVNGNKLTGTASGITNGYTIINDGATIITYNSYIKDFLIFDLVGIGIDGSGNKTYMSRYLVRDYDGLTYNWDNKSSTSTRANWSDSIVRNILNGSFYNGFPT